jgi:hypothetical protein
MRVSDPCSIQRQLNGDALTAMRAMSNLTPSAGRHSRGHTLETMSKLRTSDTLYAVKARRRPPPVVRQRGAPDVV